MTEVLFYHLTRRPLEATLPELLEKTLARGWRAVVRCGSPERLASLDNHLWMYGDGTFLPHGGPDPETAPRQPIYLTTGEETPNGAQILFLVDGVTAPPEAVAAFERVCLLFDDADPVAVASARAAWKEHAEAGGKLVYWAQDPSGRWIKKRESGG